MKKIYLPKEIWIIIYEFEGLAYDYIKNIKLELDMLSCKCICKKNGEGYYSNDVKKLLILILNFRLYLKINLQDGEICGQMKTTLQKKHYLIQILIILKNIKKYTMKVIRIIGCAILN